MGIPRGRDSTQQWEWASKQIHSTVTTVLQETTFHPERKKGGEGRNPEKSVSTAVSKINFLRNLTVKVSFVCTSTKEANSWLANEFQNRRALKSYFQKRLTVPQV